MVFFLSKRRSRNRGKRTGLGGVVLMRQAHRLQRVSRRWETRLKYIIRRHENRRSLSRSSVVSVSFSEVCTLFCPKVNARKFL